MCLCNETIWPTFFLKKTHIYYILLWVYSDITLLVQKKIELVALTYTHISRTSLSILHS